MGALNLGVFSAMQGVSDRNRARQQAEQAKQMMLEDRLRSRQMQDQATQRQGMLDQRQSRLDEAALKSRTIEDALHQAQIGATNAKASQVGQPKQKTLPSTAVEKMVGVDNMLSNAHDVEHSLESAIREGRNVTGRTMGIKTPTWVKNTFGMGNKNGDQGGVTTRSIVNSLKGTIAKERAGTSMTPSELDLLESYVPSDNDDEAVALAKAKQFIKTLEQVKSNRMNAYGKYGYGVGAEQMPEGQDEGLPFPDYNP